MANHVTSWIPRAAMTRSTPVPRLPAPREAVLEAVLHPTRLPTLPAVAVKVVEVASKPDCRPGEIVSILSRDPALCAQLLRAVNSARTGLTKPIGSLDRAVLVVGLNKVRSLALGLSLPSMRPQSRQDPAALAHSLASVGGAILAQELAVRLRHPSPEDDLIAGLLRDIGVLLLQQAFPVEWAELAARGGDPLEEERCAREREVFATDHAEVAAEVLRLWGLPAEVSEPIRHHHHPDRLSNTGHVTRGELLWFTGLLTRLDAVVEHPEALDRVLSVSTERFGMPPGELAAFLEDVRPKIDQFAQLLNRDIGRCPNYAGLLSAASKELVRLAEEV